MFEECGDFPRGTLFLLSLLSPLSLENPSRTNIASCEASDFIILMVCYKSGVAVFFDFISPSQCKQQTHGIRRKHNSAKWAWDRWGLPPVSKQYHLLTGSNSSLILAEFIKHQASPSTCTLTHRFQ